MMSSFDFGHANLGQRKAIETTEGPVLIIAAPGTGKTFTLVNRVVYLLSELKVDPGSIFVATFTDKAAKELVTRISNALEERDLHINVNDLYVGTFHSLALRIIKENLEYTRLKTGFRVLDQFDQAYLVFQNFHRFSTIDNIDVLLPQKSKWYKAQKICGWVNALAEELITPEVLVSDTSVEEQILARIYLTYNELLEDQNMLDFAGIQVEALRMLTQIPEVATKYHEALSYLMVDEYQDTNYIQEQLIFKLANTRNNICVVGDDDQGLYRFRGATIRNILQFDANFPAGDCTVIKLENNYRSTPGIVDFYTDWMQTTDGAKFKFDWGDYRFDKNIVAAGQDEPASPTVIKVAGDDDPDNWHGQILEFIRALEASGKLTDYNQIAFLFKSVKSKKVKALADYLEANGVNVYSPRSAMFFERAEVQLALGCLLLAFPNYIAAFDAEEYHWLNENYQKFIIDCIVRANEYLTEPDAAELRAWVRRHGIAHDGLTEPTDYTFSGLLYQLFAFEPFRSILSTPMDTGITDLRPVRNLALLTQLVGKFEYLHNVMLLSPKQFHGKRQIDAMSERLFNLYFRLLWDGGIGEYEDDSEYAPSGCVSFMTIHQSKGMEFPIVLTDSLDSVPRKQEDKLLTDIIERHGHRPPFEPRETIKYFDFWRLYYTAFSRAQNLLVLTADESKSVPSQYFRQVYDGIPAWNSAAVNLSDNEFETVKDVNLKRSFSFTGDITVYETCSIQYKFFNDLAFQPVRVNAMLFGRLVHQTIEDIHKAALRGEEHLITKDNIATWFEANYAHLSKAERVYLAEAPRRIALKQVQRYAEKQKGGWDQIKEAEVDVSLVEPDYILDGTIDLIKGEDDTVEIVDFKTTKKPDLHTESELLERYRRQLHVYAHLVAERTGQRVSKMHLYYTGEDDGSPLITWNYSPTAVEGTIQAFDHVVHQILSKNYSTPAQSLKTCRACDFNAYCAQATFRTKENPQ